MFITDRNHKDIGGEDSTTAEIKDNNGATRVRANGHSELEDGSTIGIQFEYAADASVSLRHANVQFTNPVAGKITVGQGSEAGDGSAGLGPGVTGIGAGQDGFSTYNKARRDAIAAELGVDPRIIPSTFTGLGAFFGSLDGGGRTNMIRYDTPALGPVSAAASVGNNDSVSGLIALKSEFSDTSFGAQVGWHKQPRGLTNGVKAANTPDPSELSASFGVTMPSGFAVGGAWGKGKNQTGTLRVAGTAATAASTRAVYGCFTDAAQGTEGEPGYIPAGTLVRPVLDLNNDGTATDPGCPDTGSSPGDSTLGWGSVTTPGTAAVPVTKAEYVDPSYFRLGIGYTFGGTTVAGSWYKSQDFVVKKSEGTALGIGASHTLPKAGATLHASVQNYKVELDGLKNDLKETVFQIGTLVKF